MADETIETNQDDLRKMLAELLRLDHRLNEYELKFIDNLHGWIGEFRPKQTARLEDIYYAHF
jgi:hypothetical protein